MFEAHFASVYSVKQRKTRTWRSQQQERGAYEEGIILRQTRPSDAIWPHKVRTVFPASCWYLASLNLHYWRKRWNVPPKRVNFHWTSYYYISEERNWPESDPPSRILIPEKDFNILPSFTSGPTKIYAFLVFWIWAIWSDSLSILNLITLVMLHWRI
jgi:hypothetical protein